MGDDSIESLKKKRAEEAAEKEKHRQFSRMVRLFKIFFFTTLKFQDVKGWHMLSFVNCTRN